MQYYLKAEFHFNKDEFADLMIIDGIAESISQVARFFLINPSLFVHILIYTLIVFYSHHIYNMFN